MSSRSRTKPTTARQTGGPTTTNISCRVRCVTAAGVSTTSSKPAPHRASGNVRLKKSRQPLRCTDRRFLQQNRHEAADPECPLSGPLTGQSTRYARHEPFSSWPQPDIGARQGLQARRNPLSPSPGPGGRAGRGHPAFGAVAVYRYGRRQAARPARCLDQPPWRALEPGGAQARFPVPRHQVVNSAGAAGRGAAGAGRDQRRSVMKVGVLQFFGWQDRAIPLPSIYAMALDRIGIMDQNGYDAVWLAEHHFSSFSVCPSVHMMGVMAAARTKRLRIGTGVSLAPFYNPLRLAEEVALLDVLSGGRVNWGAGRGFERSEFKAFGIPGEESAARFHETADIVLKAWTSEKLTYQGKYYSYDGVEVLPKPVQEPHPPVWMAASSAPAIDWAASRGFSILMDPHCSRDDLIRKRQHYAAKLVANGHREAHRVIPMARLIAIDETTQKAREVARRAAGWMLGAYIGNAAHHRQEARTFAGRDPTEFYLEEVMLHGTAESVVDQIRALGEAGMTYLMAAPLSRRSFVLLTDKVVPQIAT